MVQSDLPLELSLGGAGLDLSGKQLIFKPYKDRHGEIR